MNIDLVLLAAGAAALAVVAAEPPGPAPDELRPSSELLSRDQLLELVRSLAGQHLAIPLKRSGLPLLTRLRASGKALQRAYREVAGAAERREPLAPAAEWLLDNFHIVEEQLAETRRHLPRQYYADLLKLDGGPYAGFPRVYALACEIVAHSDGALDANALRDYVLEYQKQVPLQIGELWAVPIMLRVSLLESLAALVAPLEGGRQARLEADSWAERLVHAAADRPAEVTVLLGELARRRAKLTGTHVVRLLQRLRGRGPAMAPVLDWLAARVEERTDYAVDDYVRLETHSQATDQVSISNTISSFRLLEQIPWEEFFEATSVVERELREDPTYAGSDFPTRDACRHVVERIARRAKVVETDVAAAAVQLARRPVTDTTAPDPRSTCAPYDLLDDGLRELEGRFRYSASLPEGVERLVKRFPTFFYLGGIGALTVVLVALAVAYAASAGAGPGMLLLTALVGLLPASDLAVATANWLVTRRLSPRVLAKRDLRSGIPDACRTLVAVPSLLTSTGGVEELLERLEIHYLANPDANLRFALLTDFTDAGHETEPGDQALLAVAVQGVLRLNARYEKPELPGPFLLLHRRRGWNAAQGCWMGWERKRGKLVELNRWLRGDRETSFTVTIGDLPSLGNVRYVLCLDSDTRLPPDAAARLVGALSHPLNQAVINPALRRVVKGHGILQPRVSITLTSAARSLFTRVFSGNAGVDPYTTAVSDVYQDLFGEGVFCGKGLYDVDAFQAVLEGRIAENTLLSHDLFEGSFARCGLATDVELFDDYPLRYDSCTARQHRWIRGDWQLLRWLLPRVRQEDGRSVPNPLSAIARWKMFDNLRRSLIAPGLLVLLAAGWLVLPGSELV
ncbi:MAG: cellobiose phosphorylase, partial [Armatimonadetes bacterium]|nr:cellobiose phosphorylase [Armatimonadota bacterium]